MSRVLVGMCLLLSTLLARDAWPCAGAPPEGKHVYIAEEEAIIIWDAATKTETFIRRAAFQSDAASFGFLVPTPTIKANKILIPVDVVIVVGVIVFLIIRTIRKHRRSKVGRL